MKKYKILIIEDNDEQLIILRKNLENSLFYEQLDIQEKNIATKYQRAVKILESDEHFDISILDILLDEGTKVYSLLNKYGEDKFGKIILNSSDPREKEMLDNYSFTNKYYSLKNKYYTESLTGALLEVLSDLKDLEMVSKNEATILSVSGREFLVRHSHIVSLEVNDNYTHIYFVSIGGKVFKSVIQKPLKELLLEYNEDYFFRTHRSYAININYFNNYIKAKKSIVLNAEYGSKQLTATLAEDNKIKFFEVLKKTTRP
jgi:CheY-like chemotaxis protein